MDLSLETLASFTQKKNVLQQANELGNYFNFISGILAVDIHCRLNLVCVVRHWVPQRHPSPSDGRAPALAAVTVHWMCSLLLLWTARAKLWCSQCDPFMQSELTTIFLRPGTQDIDDVSLSSLYSVYCSPGIPAPFAGLSIATGCLLEALEDEDRPASKSLHSCLSKTDYSPSMVRELVLPLPTAVTW